LHATGSSGATSKGKSSEAKDKVSEGVEHTKEKVSEIAGKVQHKAEDLKGKV
jgi:uncharacterized protein YjbJ (UPF0337 family)